MQTLYLSFYWAKRWLAVMTVLIFLGTAGSRADVTDRKPLPQSGPQVAGRLSPLGDLPETNQLSLAVGLPLHHVSELKALFQQMYDPRSSNYHKYLAPPEFTARFGPTEQDYQAVIQFAEANGLTVARQYSNRAVLDVRGSVADIGRAFQVTLHNYRHPTEARNFFAPDGTPSVPMNLPVADL